MALLHYLNACKKKLNLTLSVVNCDHAMRENSSSDSTFVKNWCKENSVPFLLFSAQGLNLSGEQSARNWRRNCYFKAVKGLNGDGEMVCQKANFLATAHHMDDNAETVLFNIARGSALSGVCGIRDGEATNEEGSRLCLIHPLINCTRKEIDEYVKENAVSFIDDETNFKDDYTRNYIRRHVLPELNRAVPDATNAVYRFSRLAEADEKFIRQEMLSRNILTFYGDTAIINKCEIYPLFSRAVIEAVKVFFNKKDYTSSMVEAIYALQFAETGKRFEFLNLVAFKEDDKIAICPKVRHIPVPIVFGEYKNQKFGQFELSVSSTEKSDLDGTLKPLQFDFDKIPSGAVVRVRKTGDKFKKFGGGNKSLGDYMTDVKIPVRLRDILPLVAIDDIILAVCGVEISDNIKVDDKTANIGYIYCKNN